MTHYGTHPLRLLLLALLLASPRALSAQSIVLTASSRPILLIGDTPQETYELCVFNPTEFTIAKKFTWLEAERSRGANRELTFELEAHEVVCEVFTPHAAGALLESSSSRLDRPDSGSRQGGVYNRGDLTLTELWLLASDGTRSAEVSRRRTFWAYTYTSYNR